jgi:hypothetical protein
MSHLFLHVGMHKTGTSSIQTTLHANRHLLGDHGIGYFDRAVNHSTTLRLAFPDDHTPGATPEKRAKLQQSLTRFLTTSGHPTLVISGEGAAHLTRGAAREMLAFLRQRVDRVTIVMFVRPPRSAVASVMQQRIRAGLPIEKLGLRTWPNYPRALGKFFAMRGACDLVLQIYTPRELTQGCSVATFLQIIGANPDLYGKLVISSENSSLSAPAVALQLAAIEALGSSANRSLIGRHIRRAKELRHVEGPPFRLPDAVLDHVLSAPKARAAVAWMEQRLGRSFAEFEAPIPDKPPEGAPTAVEWARSTLTSLDWEGMKALARVLDRLVSGVAEGSGEEPEDDTEEDEA